MKAYKGHVIFTREKEQFDIVANGYVLVDAGRVVDVTADSKSVRQRGIEVVDFGDRLIIPAMVDVHVHAPQFRNMGLAMDLELLDWLSRYTFPEESRYADVSYAQRMYERFVRELWRQGTMRAIVFATVHAESTLCLMNLFARAGMGALVGLVNMDRDCPEALCRGVNQAQRDMESIVSQWSRPDALVRPIVTPRFVPSCSPEMLSMCGHMAAKHGLPVQSHLSENTGEIELVKTLEPQSRNYADAYDRYGLLGPQTVMAHCVWTHGEELDLLRQRGVMVAHCPASNFNLSSGMAPVRSFLDAGVRVGLGSDISAGHSLSIFRTMVYAIEVSKMLYQRDRSQAMLSLSEAFWMATKSGGSMFGRVGSFEPGYEFDALVIDDSELNHDDYALQHRIERFVYLGDDRNIVHRFCRGSEVKM